MHKKNKPPIPQQEYIYGTRSERSAQLKSLGSRVLQNTDATMTKHSRGEMRPAVRASERAVLGFANAQEGALDKVTSGLEFVAQARGCIVDAYVDRPDDDTDELRWVVRVVNNAAERVTTFSLRTGHDIDDLDYNGALNEVRDSQIVDPATGRGYDGWDYPSRMDVNELNLAVGTAFSALSDAQKQGTLQVTKLPDQTV